MCVCLSVFARERRDTETETALCHSPVCNFTVTSCHIQNKIPFPDLYLRILPTSWCHADPLFPLSLSSPATPAPLLFCSRRLCPSSLCRTPSSRWLPSSFRSQIKPHQPPSLSLHTLFLQRAGFIGWLVGWLVGPVSHLLDCNWLKALGTGSVLLSEVPGTQHGAKHMVSCAHCLLTECLM